MSSVMVRIGKTWHVSNLKGIGAGT